MKKSISLITVGGKVYIRIYDGRNSVEIALSNKEKIRLAKSLLESAKV